MSDSFVALLMSGTQGDGHQQPVRARRVRIRTRNVTFSNGAFVTWWYVRRTDVSDISGCYNLAMVTMVTFPRTCNTASTHRCLLDAIGDPMSVFEIPCFLFRQLRRNERHPCVGLFRHPTDVGKVRVLTFDMRGTRH
jgi:hypothetical protein